MPRYPEAWPTIAHPPSRGWSIRRGFIVPVVVIFLGILAIFLFSYSRSLSTHQSQLRRLQFGSMCAHLAVGCANVVAQVMEKETGSIYEELSTGNTSRFSYLLDRRLGAGEKVDIPIPATSYGRYETLVREMVQSVQADGLKFTFDSLKVFFEGVTRLDATSDPTFQYSDFLEKRGYLTVEVTVSTDLDRKVTKAARIRRPFKVVSLLPPIHGRFSLFVAQTPDAESYNVVTHVPGSPAVPKPLVIRAGPAPVAYTSPPQLVADGLELQLNGWVYLGPTHAAPNDNVYLNIADGYAGPDDQMFLFGKDPGNAIIRYAVKDPLGLRHWLNTDPFPIMLFHRFEGVSNQRQTQYNTQNLFGVKVNPLVSWLQLYGNRAGLARTLVLGPVFGRLLKLMEMGPFGWEPDGSDKVKSISDPVEGTKKAWNRRIQLSRASFDPGAQLPSQFHELYRRAKRADADTSHAPGFWGDVFQPPERYGDYACKSIFVPFNQFFDLVNHPTPPTLSLPSWFFLPIDVNDATYITPDSVRSVAKTVSPNSPGGILNSYLGRDYVTFGYSQGGGKEYFRFAGDLNRFRSADLVPWLYEGRATKQFFLKGTTPAEEAESFKSLLLIGGRVLDLTGIILIHRDPRTPKPAPLVLPADLIHTDNTVLVFDRGDVAIDGWRAQARDRHLTLVALDGSFHVTSKLIQAYLVALKPRASSGTGRPGSIVSRDGGSLNLDGGLAVQELGVPGPGGPTGWGSYFSQGGVLQYNHTYNPCNYWVEDYYSLFVADCSPFVEVVEP